MHTPTIVLAFAPHPIPGHPRTLNEGLAGAEAEVLERGAALTSPGQPLELWLEIGCPLGAPIDPEEVWAVCCRLSDADDIPAEEIFACLESGGDNNTSYVPLLQSAYAGWMAALDTLAATDETRLLEAFDADPLIAWLAKERRSRAVTLRLERPSCASWMSQVASSLAHARGLHEYYETGGETPLADIVSYSRRYQATNTLRDTDLARLIAGSPAAHRIVQRGLIHSEGVLAASLRQLTGLEPAIVLSDTPQLLGSPMAVHMRAGCPGVETEAGRLFAMRHLLFVTCLNAMDTRSLNLATYLAAQASLARVLNGFDRAGLERWWSEVGRHRMQDATKDARTLSWVRANRTTS